MKRHKLSDTQAPNLAINQFSSISSISDDNCSIEDNQILGLANIRSPNDNESELNSSNLIDNNTENILSIEKLNSDNTEFNLSHSHPISTEYNDSESHHITSLINSSQLNMILNNNMPANYANISGSIYSTEPNSKMDVFNGKTFNTTNGR